MKKLCSCLGISIFFYACPRSVCACVRCAKRICSLIIVAVLLVPVLALAAEEPIDSHPIFSEKDWVKYDTRDSSFQDSNYSTSVFYRRVFYKNEVKHYRLIEHVFFDELIMKTYMVMNQEKKIAEHNWLQFKKDDGVWNTEYFGYFYFELRRDDLGRAIVIVTFKDDYDKVIGRREVKRK